MDIVEESVIYINSSENKIMRTLEWIAWKKDYWPHKKSSNDRTMTLYGKDNECTFLSPCIQCVCVCIYERTLSRREIVWNHYIKNTYHYVCCIRLTIGYIWILSSRFERKKVEASGIEFSTYVEFFTHKNFFTWKFLLLFPFYSIFSLHAMETINDIALLFFSCKFKIENFLRQMVMNSFRKRNVYKNMGF